MRIEKDEYQFFLLVKDLDGIDQRIETIKQTMPQITDIRLHRITQYLLTIVRGDDVLTIHYDLGNTPFTGTANGMFVDKELWNTAMYVFDGEGYDVRLDITRKIQDT